MRKSASEITSESRVVKAVLHGEYNEFPSALRQLIELAPLGFEHPSNGQILAAYRSSLGNGGNVGAYLEGDLAFELEFYKTSKEVETPEQVLGDVRRLLKNAVRQRLSNSLSSVDESPSQAWEIMQQCAKVEATPASCSPLPWVELNKPVSYENNLLGNRFLERGQGLLIFGPAGCGKSVAGLQACVEWSCGVDAFHIQPSKPLRIVIIQTEDSIDDTREMLKGIRSVSYLKAQHQALVEQNLFILPAVPGSDPDALYRTIESTVNHFKADIVSVNPLLAFCPGDPSRELGGILYQTIDPVIKKCHVGFLGIHHTPKTNLRDTSGYGRHDHQYSAAGDARVANWPRAMISIEEEKYPVYRFRCTKRDSRTGWTWDQKPTNERYFRHMQPEIRWADATPEEVTSSKTKDDYRKILDLLPKSGDGISRDRLRQVAKDTLSIGKDKADQWLKLVLEDRLAERYETTTDSNRKLALFRLPTGESQDPF